MGTIKRFSQEEVAQIEMLLREGKTYIEIGRIMDRSPRSIEDKSLKLGLTKKLKSVDSIDDEVWKVIPEFTKYSISNKGRLKVNKTNTLRKPKTAGGYLRVRIVGDDGNEMDVAMHRLVAVLFVDGATEERSEVNHKNGVKSDNEAVNLEWVSPKENVQHAHKNGLAVAKKGSQHNLAKLSDSEVHAICRHLQNGERQCDILALLKGKVTKNALTKIYNRQNWTHISEQYTW